MAEAEGKGGGGIEEIEGSCSCKPFTNPFSRCVIFRFFFLFLIFFNILFVSARIHPISIFQYSPDLSFSRTFAGEASEAQDHSRGRGEKIGSEKEGGGRASPAWNRWVRFIPICLLLFFIDFRERPPPWCFSFLSYRGEEATWYGGKEKVRLP